MLHLCYFVCMREASGHFFFVKENPEFKFRVYIARCLFKFGRNLHQIRFYEALLPLW